MRILITGCNGFVGRHLAAELLQARHEVFGLDVGPPSPALSFPVATGDICDPGALQRAVRGFCPDGCIHLAGIASVPLCSQQPELAFRINVLGTLNVLDALQKKSPDARLLVVSTAQVYGFSPSSWLDETVPPQPDSQYALSKFCAETASFLRARESRLSVFAVRPVNHIGPGQTTHFVISSFASQLAAIVRGRADSRLQVGNVDSERDFLDVRDVVRGYRLLLEKGVSGECYNLASGRLIPIRHALDVLCRIAGISPTRELDPARFRPTERSLTLRCAKLQQATGWIAAIPLEQTLRDIYEDALKSGPGGT